MDRTVRQLIPADMSGVLEVDINCFKDLSWDMKTFASCLVADNCFGIVVEDDEKLIGYCIYALLDFHLVIYRMGVFSGYRREGCGSQMFQRMIRTAQYYNLREIAFEVPESNIGGHMFFKANGCIAKHVLKGHYSETGEDAYHFVRETS